MATEWAVKELLTAEKMNKFGNRRMTTAEQLAVVDTARLVGDQYQHTDRKTLQIYQSGLGATFKFTELTNLLYRDETQMGSDNTTRTLVNEAFVNKDGRMGTRVFFVFEYLPEASQVWSIDCIVTDGTTPVTVTRSGTAGGSPTAVYDVVEVATTSFAEDDVLNCKMDVNDAQIQYVEIRGV
jgi:hypothetical protein